MNKQIFAYFVDHIHSQSIAFILIKITLNTYITCFECTFFGCQTQRWISRRHSSACAQSGGWNNNIIMRNVAMLISMQTSRMCNIRMKLSCCRLILKQKKFIILKSIVIIFQSSRIYLFPSLIREYFSENIPMWVLLLMLLLLLFKGSIQKKAHTWTQNMRKTKSFSRHFIFICLSIFVSRVFFGYLCSTILFPQHFIPMFVVIIIYAPVTHEYKWQEARIAKLEPCTRAMYIQSMRKKADRQLDIVQFS